MSEFLEFEEQVGRRWHQWASRAASYRRHPEAAVELEQVRAALGVFFRATGGAHGLAVGAIKGRGSRHRLTWRQRLGFDEEIVDIARRDDESLLLPPSLDYFPEAGLNRDLYFWLAAFLAVVRQPPPPANALLRDIAQLRAASRASQAVCQLFPGLAVRYRRLCQHLLEHRPQRRLPPAEAALEVCILRLLGGQPAAVKGSDAVWAAIQATDTPLPDWRAPRGYRPPLPVPLWGEALTLASGIAAAPGEPGADDAETHTPKAASAGARKAERRHQDQSERDDPLLLNRFEKLLSWTEMVNVNRIVEDEEDEAAKRAAEQMEEITLSKHRQTTSTRLQMELDVARAEVEQSRVRGPRVYPEWHYKKQSYLPRHCAVYPGIAAESGEDWQPDAATKRRIRLVQRQFEALRPKREILRRQLDGVDLDTDALIRSCCDLAATGEGSDRIYQTTRNQARDLAVAILVDVSLSTDAWLKSHRVLDVEKEALSVLAHGLAATGDDYAIYTFTSQRRTQVWVNSIKGFEERMSERVGRRIRALKPGHYTRMGAALRHVTAELAQRPNRNRLLLVITDGKPNDTDHYEGRYGLEDTRKAVLEARREAIAVFGVTIDDSAQQYFPHLFGRGAYSIVGHPARLAAALPAIYRQLVKE